ncbi:peptidase [Bacillus sp. OxB-1]|uniref:peptidoglycan DD-metalloendopeptidase family protein n=1 Tax=Bacillus sp. (strain OxB-1) TaxID=98228 RepID=UPI000581CF06|nr:peptidoglycan DD-metalloendopeptidase family protein [Bacillus sp. OxB-1]BAQ11282.1 peptidase [Bacillus sp. OxB-1]
MFIRPCEGRITSYFSSARLDPVNKKTIRPHYGVDYGNSPSNNNIVAAAAGKVRIASRSNSGYGNYVIITHANGWETVYAHLASIAVRPGQTVGQGQKIGVKGTTGNSTGVHLHFEVHAGRWDANYSKVRNPLHYLIDPEVKRLQQLLVNAGQKIAIDGKFGPATEAAVKDFQKSSGLVVDGSAGPATIAALEKKKEVAAVSTLNHTPSPSHKTGWEWAEKQGYMNGKWPKEPLTREQFASVLMKVVADMNKR